MFKNKYKVCVYAISKNEEKTAKRWVESMSEADEIYVLDTGSTDNTVKILKKLGVKVKKKSIIPWRFDEARNKSLELLPGDTDICVCTDLDEVFEKGWRKELESIWNENTNKISYNYNWCLDEKAKPLVNFYIEKIHERKNYRWIHPVHEILEYTGVEEEQKKITDDITLNHYPDKNKSRRSYLPLLELSVKEDPHNDRNMHYLGREYMYYGKSNECIKTLKKHLSLPSATWKDERAASMRFIGRSYISLKKYGEAIEWFQKAIEEAPYLREGYVELALIHHELNNWKEVKENCLNALKIKYHPKTYINEVFSWNNTIYDLLSISYYNTGENYEAYKYINIALLLKPDDERLLLNKKIIEEALLNNLQHI